MMIRRAFDNPLGLALAVASVVWMLAAWYGIARWEQSPNALNFEYAVRLLASGLAFCAVAFFIGRQRKV